MISEKELLIKVKLDSSDAYRMLYEHWVSRLHSFVLHYVKSEALTDDIVQETFFRIWKNRKSLNPDASFKSYIFTISYHLVLKELRHQLNSTSIEDYIKYCNDVMTSGNEIVETLDFDVFKEALSKAKLKLSPRQLQIFELNKELGYSIAEIAAKFSINEQVVRNQLSIAIKLLRKELSKQSVLLLTFFCLVYSL